MGGVISFVARTVAQVVIGHYAEKKLFGDHHRTRRQLGLQQGGNDATTPRIECVRPNGDKYKVPEELTLVPAGTNCTFIDGDLCNLVAVQDGATLTVVSSNIDSYLVCDHCGQISVIDSKFTHGGVIMTEPPMLERSLNIEHTQMDGGIVRITKTVQNATINFRLSVEDSIFDHLRIEESAFVGVAQPSNSTIVGDNFFYIGGPGSFEEYNNSTNLVEQVGDATVSSMEVSASKVIQLAFKNGNVFWPEEIPSATEEEAATTTNSMTADFGIPSFHRGGPKISTFAIPFGFCVLGVLAAYVSAVGIAWAKRSKGGKYEELKSEVLGDDSIDIRRYGSIQSQITTTTTL